MQLLKKSSSEVAKPGFHPPGGGASSGLIRKHPQWLVNGFPGTSARAAFKVRFSVSTRGPRLWPGGPSAVPSIVTLPEPASRTFLGNPSLEPTLQNPPWQPASRIILLAPGLGTEHLPGALCSGNGSPALGLCLPSQGSEVSSPPRLVGSSEGPRSP